MKPLAAFPLADRRALVGVLTDIDDTITTDGHLSAAAYSALERLRAAGLRVVPVTGRPAGWCDLIARLWPVDAVVGENGAFYMHHDRVARRLRTVHAVDAATRATQRERLAALGQEIIEAVPGCALASDQAYREADLAIDFCEDVPPLPQEAVDAIVRRMESAGLTARISSIHVNGWFGAYDKLSMTRRLVAEVFGGDLDRDRERWVFLGDSPNDAPMFGFFPHAIGVANVRALADRTPHLPAYITAAASGAGFVEACEFLLAEK